MNLNPNESKRLTVNDFFESVKNLDDTIYQIQITNKFKKSLDLSFRRGLDLLLLKNVIHTLAKGEKLDTKYRSHTLEGHRTVIWECHIKPNWLLLWQQNDEELILIFLDTGSHSDLF